MEKEEGDDGEGVEGVGWMWRDWTREERARRRAVGGCEMWKIVWVLRLSVVYEGGEGVVVVWGVTSLRLGMAPVGSWMMAVERRFV